MTLESAPRIQLKLRLNKPAAPEEESSKKKHRHRDKSRKSHKKHKKKHHYNDHVGQPQEQSYAHVPMGGKRPFALLQENEHNEDGEDDLYADENHDYGKEDEDEEDHGLREEGEYEEEEEGEEEKEDYEEEITVARPSVMPQQAKKAVEKPKKRGRPPKNKTPPKKLTPQPQPAKKDMLSARKDAYGFFLEPVDTQVVTDYLSVIRRPMDLSTMRQKLEMGEYQHMDSFREDFMLIVTNAKTYNAPNTIYWRSADRLEQYATKAIDRAAKMVVYGPDGGEVYVNNGSRKYLTASVNIKMEEEVDILGTTIGSSLAEFTLSTREPSVDFVPISRSMTPTRPQGKKKKKKLMEASGSSVYAPDGSLTNVNGVSDLSSLIPPNKAFASLPQLTTPNRHALPSAFFSRNTAEDFNSHKHIVHQAYFNDYGPFTALGLQVPGDFRTIQDVAYIDTMYGGDMGEAYMRSLWDFTAGLNLEDETTEKSQYLTRGAWNLATRVLSPNLQQEVETEFGSVDVLGILGCSKE
ncbi:hypothetical protein DFQ28_000056 [Apophysomyces sp. BC1034]|nr:hypothetical protein DFQ30_007787 [Apophysomyces sp. BC1015]KAG0182833.1 hypothetical protein DFQ29_001773 [Apophysomyces sp. BC1021]KAG0194957.1 hypothetical protein DFQ28_000056 [Apophysomyces sp. BC1034]